MINGQWDLFRLFDKDFESYVMLCSTKPKAKSATDVAWKPGNNNNNNKTERRRRPNSSENNKDYNNKDNDNNHNEEGGGDEEGEESVREEKGNVSCCEAKIVNACNIGQFENIDTT